MRQNIWVYCTTQCTCLNPAFADTHCTTYPQGMARLSGPTEAGYTDDLSSTLLPIGFNIQRLHWCKKVQHRQAKLPWTMYEIINNQIRGFLDQKQQQLCGMDTSSTWQQHWRDEWQTCAGREEQRQLTRDQRWNDRSRTRALMISHGSPANSQHN